MTKIESGKFSNKLLACNSHDTDPLVLGSQMLIDIVTDLNNRKQTVKICIGGVLVCIASTLAMMKN